MKEKIAKYIKILRIELEDLEEDLLLMAEIYHQREQKDEISDYVFLENLSLLQSEISGIDHIIQSLGDIDATAYSSIEEFVETVASAFKKKTADAGFPNSVNELVKRKLQKVTKYLLNAEE